MPREKPRSPRRPPRPGDARSVALALLRQWETSDAPIDDLLGKVGDIDARERRLLQELVYGVVRQRRRLNYVLDHFCSRGLDSVPLAIRCLLRLGAYQILFSDRIPAYAAVDSAVRLAREWRFGGMAGLVNAVLRRVADPDREVPFPDPESERIRYLGVVHSFPDWLVERVVGLFGETNAEAMLRRANEVPPLHVRVNRLKTETEPLIRLLEQERAQATKDDQIPFCLLVETEGPLTALKTFADGYFQVQDRSAQLVAPVVDPQPGEVVVDACSAPGGKATHLAELMGDQGTVMAVDRDPHRLERVRQSAQRLGLSCISAHLGDATGDLAFLPEKVDRILVDAPCSGLGTLGRRPDLRWRLEPDTASRLAKDQVKILTNMARRLKPGGVLVYSTCTLTPEENQGFVKAFLERNSSFDLESAAAYLPSAIQQVVDSDGYIETLPFRDDMDGTFVARLVRK